MKAKFLVFGTGGIARMESRKIEDGKVQIGEKLYDVDQFTPQMLETRFGGHQPFYMLKWDCIHPPDNVNPRFEMDGKLTPELLAKVSNMKILGNMLKSKRQVGGLMYVILGAAFGAFIIYYLISTKVITL